MRQKCDINQAMFLKKSIQILVNKIAKSIIIENSIALLFSIYMRI